MTAVIEHGEQLADVAQRYQVHTRTIRRAIKDHLAEAGPISPEDLPDELLVDLKDTR